MRVFDVELVRLAGVALTFMCEEIGHDRFLETQVPGVLLVG